MGRQIAPQKWKEKSANVETLKYGREERGREGEERRGEGEEREREEGRRGREGQRKRGREEEREKERYQSRTEQMHVPEVDIPRAVRREQQRPSSSG